MLKLEKASKSAHITLRLREKDNFFEPRLLIALAIALFFHLGALILFQVTPFYFSSTFTFPPIQVQTDSKQSSISTQVVLAKDDDALLPPPLNFIPDLDWVSFSQESTLMPESTLDPHVFEALEQEVWPQWPETFAYKLEVPKIQLLISGDLAHIPLTVSDARLDQMQIFTADLTSAYVTYDVQLERGTGEIFWYNRMESNKDALLNQLTEKILLNLRFSTSETHDFIKGTLRFVILGSP